MAAPAPTAAGGNVIGVDKDGQPFAVLKMELSIATTEEGAFQAGVAEWFRADNDKPIGDVDLAEIEEWCSTRIALAVSLRNTLKITDEDLRETVINAGRACRASNGEDYDTVVNVAEAAAAEQRRRDAARATPAERPTSSPTTTAEDEPRDPPR